MKLFLFQLQNFGADARQSLHCLVGQAGGYSDAAQVGYLIDDLLEAGAQYINLSSS